jgi:hypothetical protein
MIADEERISMASIPSTINNVTVEFAPTVTNSCEPLIVAALQHCIASDVASGFALNKIFVRSLKDGTHDPNSRHFQGLGKAVDVQGSTARKCLNISRRILR